MSTHFHFLHPQGGGGVVEWVEEGGGLLRKRERYGYGKPLSPALIGGDGASGFVGMCVCVCVDSVCEHPLPLLASPRGGAWWSGLRRGGGLLRKRERGRDGYGKPLSPALLGGAGASGFVGMCVCVCGQCV